MPSTTITLAGNPVVVVTLPAVPGLRSATFDASDAVAIVTSPFTGQTQAQQWPGADMWARESLILCSSIRIWPTTYWGHLI